MGVIVSGLGDIVIPGLFIALLRRFDQRLGEMKVIELQLGTTECIADFVLSP